MRVRWHSDINYVLLTKLMKLYHSAPTRHYELAYKLLHDISDTHALFNIEDDRVLGYCLYYKLCDEPTIDVYGEISIEDHLIPLIKRVGLNDYSITIPEHVVHRYIGEIRNGLNVVSETVLNRMVSTRPPNIDTSRYEVVKLGKENLDEFINLKRVGGVECSRGEAYKQLSEYLYLGIYMDNKLVSIGAAYVRLPEVWAIGGLYTHPEYRNLGLGTIISAELTRRAWWSGAKAVLKVEEENLPAFKIFTKTGYKVVGRERCLKIRT